MLLEFHGEEVVVGSDAVKVVDGLLYWLFMAEGSESMVMRIDVARES